MPEEKIGDKNPLERAKESARLRLENMDSDTLKRFADGTLSEDEYMDLSPTHTDGFDEKKIQIMAQKILKERTEK